MTPLCNYCFQPADVWFQYDTRLNREVRTITVAACNEHRTCINFRCGQDLHPEAALFRRATGEQKHCGDR